MKEILKAKVPDFVKDTPEWKVFLKWVSQNEIKNTTQLKSQLKSEIETCQAELKKLMSDSSSGTNTRFARPCAKKLDFLKLARDKIVKYL